MKQMTESDIQKSTTYIAETLLRAFFRTYTARQVDPEHTVRPPQTGDRIKISIEMENPDPEKMLSKLKCETFFDLSEVEVVNETSD